MGWRYARYILISPISTTFGRGISKLYLISCTQYCYEVGWIKEIGAIAKNLSRFSPNLTCFLVEWCAKIHSIWDNIAHMAHDQIKIGWGFI